MRQLDIPRLPAAWDELSGEQLIELNRLRRASDSGKEFKVKALCYLGGLQLGRTFSTEGSGRLTFGFRKVDAQGKAGKEEFLLEPWVVHELFEQYLSWLLQPSSRLAEVTDKITVKGRTYAGCGYAMARMTYQQHQFAARYFNEMQRSENALLQAVLDKNTSHERMEKLTDQWKMQRRLFMATVFTPVCRVSSKTVDGKVIVYPEPKEDYVFSSEQIAENADAFAGIPEEMTDAVIQQFNGVMMHYRKIYPKLFKEGDTGQADFIKVEESTLNTLQSELKFANYQTIYDSNAPFILGKLHTIILKAEEIQRMNEKMKH